MAETAMAAKGARRKSKRTEIQTTLAQFFTPSVIARYMASMFSDVPAKQAKSGVRILDPGAGEGVLGLALLNTLGNAPHTKSAFVEFDKATYQRLSTNLADIIDVQVVHGDFVDVALAWQRDNVRFTHVIMNPPYFKLRVDSPASLKLQRHGIHTTNIYAAFVWLSAALLAEGGQLVAIIPRSFCNGPYFFRFRHYLTDNFSIDQIHTFTARDKAFAADSVLQENVIIHLSKRAQMSDVVITYSSDQTFRDNQSKTVHFSDIVLHGDAERVIHIPPCVEGLKVTDYATQTLSQLGIQVSTGPIVDFRLKQQIHNDDTALASVPLIYPAHVSGGKVTWPLDTFKKLGQCYAPISSSNTTLPLVNDITITDKNVLPLDGSYVVVRRFSSKEEKRRIYASVVSPEGLDAKHATFENHLNYFHVKKHGLGEDVAAGLAAYLNTKLIDEHFRKASGHTQVNVSDLKKLPYPNISVLEAIGRAVKKNSELSEEQIIALLGAAT